jgi:hypothetical protein
MIARLAKRLGSANSSADAPCCGVAVSPAPAAGLGSVRITRPSGNPCCVTLIVAWLSNVSSPRHARPPDPTLKMARIASAIASTKPPTTISRKRRTTFK